MSFRKITDPAIATSKRRGRPPKKSPLDAMNAKYGEGKMKQFALEAGKPLSEMSDEDIKGLILAVCREKGWQV